MAAARPRTQRATQQQQAPVAAPPAPEPANDGIARILEATDVSLIKTEVPALEAITRSEVAMQLDSAHRWPRSTKRFLDECITLATITRETAQSCFYVLPAREGSDGEPIQGPSVRLAEMAASSWGNMHVGARIINIGEREITAQAVAWDLEKNLRLSFEVQRGIMTSAKYGAAKRYGDSMINVTCMAAISIAYRNAVFRIIPKALTDHVLVKAKACAVGTLATLSARRDEWLAFYTTKCGVPAERIFARLGVPSAQDITLEHVAILNGFCNALKAKETTLDECFPPLAGSTPAPVRSKGAALDVLAQAHAPKPAAQPAAAQPEAQPAVTFTPAQLLAELALADEAWGTKDASVVAQWSAADQVAAYEWATAYNDPTSVDDADLPPRPACTVLTRQPGEDG